MPRKGENGKPAALLVTGAANPCNCQLQKTVVRPSARQRAQFSALEWGKDSHFEQSQLKKVVFSIAYVPIEYAAQFLPLKPEVSLVPLVTVSCGRGGVATGGGSVLQHACASCSN